MLGLGFQNHPVADGIKRLVLDGGEPAGLRVAGPELGDFVHDVLPRSLGGGRIAGLPIHPHQMQAERGRVLGFVFGGDEAVGFLLVAGFEGGLLFGDEVLAIEGAPVAAEYPVTAFHVSVHVVSMNRLHPPALASYGRVKVIYPE